MLTPSSVRSINLPIATYKVENSYELAKHIQICSRDKISGRLDLSVPGNRGVMWSLFFRQGCLTWGAGELHPLRRWNRQLYQHSPQLAADSFQQKTERPPNWDYGSLLNQVKQGKMQQAKLAAIVGGNILELLFDIIQSVHLPRQHSELQLTYSKFPQDLIDSTLVSLQIDQAWQQAEKAWVVWQQAGLAGFSPNLAPVIWDNEGLRQQTSQLAYQNLTAMANGSWTLRDLAVKLRQPLVALTQSIMPYVNQGMMGLTHVGDISFYVKPVTGSLIAYIEDSRFDSETMGRILAPAGYRFINIRDSIQALPMLLEYKPDLIFLDLLMPVANGYEVCAQIRRISAFKNTPVIIITSNDGIVDRVRAKIVGSSGFLAKPIEQQKVLSVLQQYLSVSPLSA
ncbi:MAG: response regulator [Fischerella sp.]|jgi:CheY-like chemotaxis protein|uniref:response regulator n=1 Tax=Fischerella sp. TaxID=1191 RepID=UPI0018393ABE|nr:response regulator [Fischerella sp.]NWF60423.1 response regulator [Fischerella sp.]